MSSQHRVYTSRWFTAAVLIGALLAGAAWQQPARAAGSDKVDSSLHWVPADASFYHAWLRNREQVEAVTQSRAWTKLMALPSVQAVWKQTEDLLDPDGPYAEYRKLYDQPENRQLVELLLDMFSNEVFVYGGQDSAGLMDVLAQVNSAMSVGPTLMQITGKGGDPNKAQLISVLRLCRPIRTPSRSPTWSSASSSASWTGPRNSCNG